MKVKVPTSLNEISIRQFIQWQNVLALSDEEADATVKNMAAVSIFCNVPLESVLTFKQADIDDILKTIADTLSQEPTLVHIYDGLGFIPNLDDITAAEYIDMERYAQDHKDYARLCAVMYRPIDKKIGQQYTIKPYNGTDGLEAEYLDKPISLVLGALVFFYHLGIELLQAMTYSMKQDKAMKEALEEDLAKNGVGINQFIQSLEATISNLNKLVEWEFTNSLHF